MAQRQRQLQVLGGQAVGKPQRAHKIVFLSAYDIPQVRRDIERSQESCFDISNFQCESSGKNTAELHSGVDGAGGLPGAHSCKAAVESGAVTLLRYVYAARNSLSIVLSLGFIFQCNGLQYLLTSHELGISSVLVRP